MTNPAKRAPRAPMADDQTVTCPRCKVEHRDLTEQQWQNRHYLCRECRAKKSSERYWKDPERHLARQRANSHSVSLKYKYGLSPDDWEAMLGEQNGACAICGFAPEDPRKLHVDHDHESGQVRQLLCNNCNVGLGYFQDDPDRLLQAAFYAQRHKAPQPQ